MVGTIVKTVREYGYFLIAGNDGRNYIADKREAKEELSDDYVYVGNVAFFDVADQGTDAERAVRISVKKERRWQKKDDGNNRPWRPWKGGNKYGSGQY